MKLEYDKSSKFLVVDDHNTVRISGSECKAATDVFYYDLGYKAEYVDEQRLIITKQDLDKHFTPIEDFCQIIFSKPLGKFITYTEVYKSNDEDFFIQIDMDLQTPNIDWDSQEVHIPEYNQIIIPNLYKVTTLFYKPNDIQVCNKISEVLNNVVKHNYQNKSKISIVVKSNSGFTFKETKIKPLPVDIEKVYNDSFQDVHNHIVDSLLNTNKGVVMLHGKAGSGKSNYIKHLTTLITDKKFIFIPVDIIPHLTEPNFLGKLLDNQNSILILEDCENYLRDRDINENNNVVSTILNLSDGILSDVLGIQIICTFNSNLQKIDSALLRSGRLIAEYEFDELDVEKSNTILEDLKVDYTTNKPMILSDIYNIKKQLHSSSKNKNNKIGF